MTTALRAPACILDTDLGDTVLATWFERDRAHVCLSRKDREGDAGDTIVEWWDEDVSQAIEDGFLHAKDWHGTAYAYAKDHGLAKRLAVDLSSIWPSAVMSFVRHTPSKQRPGLQPERREWYADAAAEVAESTVKDLYFQGLSPGQAEKVAHLITGALYEMAVLSEGGPQPLRIDTKYGPIVVETDGAKLTARGGRMVAGADYALSDDRKGAFHLSWRHGEEPESGELLHAFEGHSGRAVRGLRSSVLNALDAARDEIRDLVLASREYDAFRSLDAILAASGEAGPGSGTVRHYERAYDAARAARAAARLKAVEPEREPAPAPGM